MVILPLHIEADRDMEQVRQRYLLHTKADLLEPLSKRVPRESSNLRGFSLNYLPSKSNWKKPSNTGSQRSRATRRGSIGTNRRSGQGPCQLEAQANGTHVTLSADRESLPVCPSAVCRDSLPTALSPGLPLLRGGSTKERCTAAFYLVYSSSAYRKEETP